MTQLTRCSTEGLNYCRTMAATFQALCISLAALACGAAPLQAAPDKKDATADLQRIVQTATQQLRGRIDQLPVLVPAQHPLGDILQTTVKLNVNPVLLEGQRFDGMVVTAPAVPASFAWAFACPPNVSRWYIFRESGEMTGFSDFVRRPRAKLPGSTDLQPTAIDSIALQKLDARNLAAGERYVLWFAFKDAAPAEFSIRAGFISTPSLTNTRLPNVLFPAPKP